MKISERKWAAIFITLCLCYAALRFWNLTTSCLWFDEIFSVHAAEHDWVSIFGFVAQDLIHPPLFYLLLKLWSSIGGEALFWLRLFPVIFSIVALIPFYLLCRQLKLNNSAIALALFLFGINGALIKYAQEVRMYSLLLCLSLFSLWLFVRYFNLGKSYIALIIINVLLVYTHYFGWFVIFSEVAAIGIWQNIKIRQVLIMTGIALVSFLPWFFTVWQVSQTNSGLEQNIGWMTKPDLASFFQFIFDVLEPFYYQQSSDEPTSRFFITIPLLLIIATAKIFFLKNWTNETEKKSAYLTAIFAALPILLVFLLSWVMPVSIWGTRHLIIVFVPILILTVKFLTEIDFQLLGNILLILFFLVNAAAFGFQLKTEQPKFTWCGWGNLAKGIDRNQNQKIYVLEDLTAYHFWFALRENPNVQIIKINKIEGLEEDKAYFLPRGFHAIPELDENSIAGEKFLVAFASPEWNEQKAPLRNFIEKGYKIGTPQVYKAGNFTAYLVEVAK